MGFTSLGFLGVEGLRNQGFRAYELRLLWGFSSLGFIGLRASGSEGLRASGSRYLIPIYLGPKSLYRTCSKAQVFPIWVHGP